MIQIPHSFNHRYRYIAFSIQQKNTDDHHIIRKEMISVLRLYCESLFDSPCSAYGIFLTRFKDNKGIVRCYHTEKERTINLLTSISLINQTEVTVETLGTSGTIRSVIQKHLDGNNLQDKTKRK